MFKELSSGHQKLLPVRKSAMFSILEAFPEYVLAWLVKNGKERYLQATEILLKEGDQNDSLFVVLDGLFAHSVSGLTGQRIAHFPPGSILGELSFFSDGIASESIIAEEPSLVLQVPGNILLEKLEHDHIYAADFYAAVLRVMARQHRETARHLYETLQAVSSDEMNHPLVKRTHTELDKFKQTMARLDKEALKDGSVSEESFTWFLGQAHELMVACNEVLGAQSTLADPIKAHLGSRLQLEFLPYLMTTETADRFYSKPRGYAGDYLSIHKIYQNTPGGNGRLGPVMDRLFLETPPSRAVRNRRTLLAGEIVATVQAQQHKPARVLCMASGPATEVFDAFDVLKEKTHLKATLMDIDLQALAFVDEIRGRRKLGNQIDLINENLIALFLGRSKTRIEPQDLIYSIGLIDYLNDKLIKKLLAFVHENLAPGGRVILGNFHPRNPAKEFMDYVLEWNLIHRTEEDMNRLFINSPFGRPCTRIQYEAQGVNLFAECVKS
jgi:extracellular factor (EF) 3-hydroxypalmitic acid methyl ester biosynthesis protein